MRQQGPNNRRPRTRHQNGGGSGGGHGNGGPPMGGGGAPGGARDNRPRSASSLRHQTFDSNCIELRVRGNAWQVQEKYQALARDAQSSGDRVAAENYLQHAEHYYRIIEAINEATAEEQRQRGGPPPAPFGQQPDMPPNYYGSSGAPQPQHQPASNGMAGHNPAHGNPNGNIAPSDTNGNHAPLSQPIPVKVEAEVQQRKQPVSSFFAPDDTDNQDGSEPMAARR